MFGEGCIWIVDDILREKDQKLANYIALKFGYLQYRFWNFSIIASPSLQIKNLEAISDVALVQLQLKSDYYVSKFYPSI